MPVSLANPQWAFISCKNPVFWERGTSALVSPLHCVGRTAASAWHRASVPLCFQASFPARPGMLYIHAGLSSLFHISTLSASCPSLLSGHWGLISLVLIPETKQCFNNFVTLCLHVARSESSTDIWGIRFALAWQCSHSSFVKASSLKDPDSKWLLWKVITYWGLFAPCMQCPIVFALLLLL